MYPRLGAFVAGVFSTAVLAWLVVTGRSADAGVVSVVNVPASPMPPTPPSPISPTPPSHDQRTGEPDPAEPAPSGRWGDPDAEYEVLVLVIAGNYAGGDGEYASRAPLMNDAYAWERAIWSQTAAACHQQGLLVRTYLISYSEEVSEPVLQGANGEMLILPGKMTFIPGILDMTTDAMEYVRAAKLPGHRHRFVLRTNLSSFWCFPLYLDILRKKAQDTGLYAGVIGGSFVSGAGITMSRDVETLLLEHKGEMRREIIDDLAIAALLVKGMGVKPQPLAPRIDITGARALPMKVQAAAHYRIKYKPPSGMREQDKWVMAYAFFQCYGVDPLFEKSLPR